MKDLLHLYRSFLYEFVGRRTTSGELETMKKFTTGSFGLPKVFRGRVSETTGAGYEWEIRVVSLDLLEVEVVHKFSVEGPKFGKIKRDLIMKWQQDEKGKSKLVFEFGSRGWQDKYVLQGSNILARVQKLLRKKMTTFCDEISVIWAIEDALKYQIDLRAKAGLK